MDTDFWHQKWAEGKLGFHKSAAHPLLVKHFPALTLPANSRIFLPLCGKTLDIAWLLSQGCRVVGAELVETAIAQLFAELGVEPQITESGALKRYSTENVDIFVGDIFEVSRELLGEVDAVYDRAALVALPQDIRDRYTAHLVHITETAPQLLITFEYDQALMTGPPFSINRAEVERQYGAHHHITQLDCIDVPGGFKGTIAATEQVWRLQPQPQKVG